MNKVYPKLFKVPNRKIDDQYYYCRNLDDVLKASKESFKTLHDMSLLYPMEKPDPDRFGEVTDEMIENAPSTEVEEALRDTRERRDRWLSGSAWTTGSLKYEQRLWDLYLSAKNGNGNAAFIYLYELECLIELDFTSYE